MKKIFTSCIATILAIVTFAQPCSKLFISEYVSGSSNNKAIEIYNPTLNAINLNGYKLLLNANGGTSFSAFNMSGTIAAGGTYVMANSAAFKTLRDTATGVCAFNGNDGVLLLNGTDTLDIFGTYGQGASAWIIINGTDTAVRHTFVRKPSVNEGTKDWSVGVTQWTTYPSNDSTHLRSHTMTPCAAPADTLASFSTNAFAVGEASGVYNAIINLNQTLGASKTVSVALTAFGNGGSLADVNNFATQTVTFAAGSSSAILPITITNDLIPEGTETFTFKISSPSAGLKLGADSMFTLSILDDDSVVVVPGLPMYPIGVIHTQNNSNLDADSANVHCKIGGVVYGINFRKTGLGFYMNDHTGGIYAFSPTKTFGYTPTEGDSIIVQGKVSQLQAGVNTGMTEFTYLDTIIKISAGNGLMAPIVLTGKATEPNESYLVRVNGLTYTSGWTNAGAGFTVIGTKGATKHYIRIDSLTTAYGTAVPTGLFDVIGLVSQWDTSAPHDYSYNINPRYAADIIRYNGIQETNTHLDAVVFPNPTTDKLYYNITTENAGIYTFSMVDVQGREVFATSKELSKGETSSAISTENVMNGVYILQITNGEKSFHTRVSILK